MHFEVGRVAFELQGWHAGVRRKDLNAAMAAGKIPLIDAEDLSAVAAFAAAGVDCLPVFLRPPSIDAYRERVHTWLSETERALVRYDAQAREQCRRVVEAGFYDDVLVNAKLNAAVKDAVDVARGHRPDLFKDVSTGEDDPFAKEPWRAVRLVYLAGNALWQAAHDAVVRKLLDVLPDRFATLPETTTRKLGKGEADTGAFIYGAKAPDLQKLKAAGQVLTWREEGADIFCRTVAAAEELYAKHGRLAVLQISDSEALSMAQAGTPASTLVVHVRSPARASCKSQRVADSVR